MVGSRRLRITASVVIAGLLAWNAVIRSSTTVAAARVLQAQESVTLRGRVVDERGRPVRDADVTLSGSAVPSRIVMSGPDGGFTFLGLAPATFGLIAHKEGFVGGELGQAFPSDSARSLEVVASKNAPAVILTLWRFGHLRGEVTTERGIPIPTVGIKVLRGQPLGSILRLSEAAAGNTDPTGRFEFDLRPGKYVVAANVLSEVAGKPAAKFLAFVPGVVSVAAATVIVVGAGEDIQELQLIRPPTTLRTVLGTVVKPDDRPWPISVELVTRENGIFQSDLSVQRVTSARDGAFRFSDVPPGAYTIRAVDYSGSGVQALVRSTGDTLQLFSGTNARNRADSETLPIMWGRQILT
jgi:hypothetical protein